MVLRRESTSSKVVARRISCSACGIFLDQGLNLYFLHSLPQAGRFFTTEPPGKPHCPFQCHFYGTVYPTLKHLCSIVYFNVPDLIKYRMMRSKLKYTFELPNYLVKKSKVIKWLNNVRLSLRKTLKTFCKPLVLNVFSSLLFLKMYLTY